MNRKDFMGSGGKTLWFAGIGLWLALNYTFFAVVTIRNPKPSLDAGINGVWLLTVVATESISVLGTLVAPSFSRAELVHFVSLAAGLEGHVLPVLHHVDSLSLDVLPNAAGEADPDYWIDMGALAIAALAGALLLSAGGRWSLLRDLMPFLAGFTLLFWTTATWWIPLLLIVEIWRHARGRVKWTCSPDYWSMVFPPGMYPTATANLDKALDLAFLRPVAMIFTCVAVLAWAITFFGLMRNLASRFQRATS